MKPGVVCWQSPSNIALIKYWGKYGNQLPQNPSLSLTLKNALTKMKVSYSFSGSGKLQTELLFEGKESPLFHKKVNSFLTSIFTYFPFLNQLKIRIETENTFPHSAGIASSASSMSALALCLCSIENDLFESLKIKEDFYKKASFIARLGSGSASRSVYGGMVLWGRHEGFSASSNEFAIPFREKIHPNFEFLNDAILIVNESVKKVSSSQGHALMQDHPYAKSR
ncbi:MAG: diphosphomevalonate decarboxylase, partial [Bacteroidetes bacterium]|nr:diphosphomevalonate decarboxylase [Bacteroidota bacterium]